MKLSEEKRIVTQEITDDRSRIQPLDGSLGGCRTHNSESSDGAISRSSSRSSSPVDHCQLIERVAVCNGHRVAANATSEYKILIPVDHHLKVIEFIILIPLDHRWVPRQALELKECQTEAIEAVENDELISSFLATYASETMVYYHIFTHFANKLDIDAMATVEEHQRHGHHRVAIAVLHYMWMDVRPPSGRREIPRSACRAFKQCLQTHAK